MAKTLMHSFPYTQDQDAISRCDFRLLEKRGLPTNLGLYWGCIPWLRREAGWTVKQHKHFTPLATIPYPSQLQQMLKEGYEVLITQHLYSIHSLIGFIITKLRGKKLGIIVKEWHFRRESLLAKIATIMGKYVTKRADFFIAQSKATQDFLQQTLRIPKRKVYYIPKTSKDYGNTDPGKSHIKKVAHEHFSRDKKNILFVGRVVPVKGVDILIRSLAPLKDQFRLIVVGDTRGNYAEYCKKLAGEYDVDVDFVGQVGKTKGSVEVVSFYKNADLVILPSKHVPDQYESVEILNFSIGEALSLGIPVIATTATGCRKDSIWGKGTGMIVQQGSVQQLRNALKDFLKNPAKWRKMGLKGPQVQKRLREKNVQGWKRLFTDIERGRI